MRVPVVMVEGSRYNHGMHATISEPLETWYFVVSGRVQGVGFRFFCTSICCNLGITGWVRNVADGTVELCVTGSCVQRRSFLVSLRSGPPLSRVSQVAGCRIALEETETMSVEPTAALSAVWRAQTENLTEDAVRNF